MSNEKKPGYLFQASMQIGEGIALTVSGNLAEGSSTNDMVGEMDKVLAALEKQNVKRMKIPAVKGALQDQKDALNKTVDQLEKLKYKDQSGEKLTSAEKAQMETCRTQISKITEQVTKGEEILSALEKEAA